MTTFVNYAKVSPDVLSQLTTSGAAMQEIIEGNTALQLLPEQVAFRKLKPNATMIITRAVERGTISPREIASFIPSQMVRNREAFSATLVWVSGLVKSNQMRVRADAEVAKEPPPPKIQRTLVRRTDEDTFHELQTTGRMLEVDSADSPEITAGVLLKEFEDRSGLDRFNEYLQMIGKFSILTRAQEQELGRRVLEENDLDARNQLVVHNLRLVPWTLKRWIHRRREISIEDLIQMGNLGLIIAANKFDYRFGFKFATYAPNWIRQSITRSIMDEGDAIRIPVHTQEKNWKILSAAHKIEEEQGRKATLDEIEAATGIPRKTIKKIRNAVKIRMQSLNQDLDNRSPKGQGAQSSLLDFLSDERVLTADIRLEAMDELEAARKTVNTTLSSLTGSLNLSMRDQDVFKAFYGFDGHGKRRTLEQTGEIFGVTRERIRQVIAKIWNRVSDQGGDMDHDRLKEELDRIQQLEGLVDVIPSQ